MTFYRFGFLVEYISQSTIVGFLAAAAVGIGLQQLKGLFGIVNFTNKTALFSVLKSLWTSFRNQVRSDSSIQFNHNSSKFIINSFFSSQRGIPTTSSLDSHSYASSYLPDSWLALLLLSYLIFLVWTRMLLEVENYTKLYILLHIQTYIG